MILKFGFELDWMRFWSSIKICDYGGLICVVNHSGKWMWLVGAMVVVVVVALSFFLSFFFFHFFFFSLWFLVVGGCG